MRFESARVLQTTLVFDQRRVVPGLARRTSVNCWCCAAIFQVYRRLTADDLRQEANLSDQDELVLFITVRDFDELIIPGVLTSRDIPIHLTERYFARQGRSLEIRVPASRLEDAKRALDDAKQVGEKLDSNTEV